MRTALIVAATLIGLAPVGAAIYFAFEASRHFLGFNDLWEPMGVVCLVEIAATLACIPALLKKPGRAVAIAIGSLGTAMALLAAGATAFCFLGAIAIGFD